MLSYTNKLILITYGSMMFSRGIILTLCICAAYAASTERLQDIFSDPNRESPTLEQPLPEGVEFDVEVFKEMPETKGTIETLHTAKTTKSKTEGKKNVDSREEIRRNNTYKTTTKDEKRTSQETDLGHETEINKVTGSEYNGNRNIITSSPKIDSNSVTTISANNQIKTQGKMIKHDLHDGQMTLADLKQMESNITFLTTHSKIDIHPDDKHHTTLQSTINTISADTVNEKDNYMEHTLTQPYSDITVKEESNNRNEKNATTSINDFQINKNTPNTKLEEDNQTTQLDTTLVSINEDKTIITRKTPLSNLLIVDDNTEATKTNIKHKEGETLRITDDKKGTTSKTRETTENNITKTTKEHTGEFTYEKKPTEGSKSLPMTVTLTTTIIDDDDIETEKNKETVVNTTTPNGSIQEITNVQEETKYNFQTIPSSNEAITPDNEECRESTIVQGQNDYSSFSVGITPRSSDVKTNKCQNGTSEAQDSTVPLQSQKEESVMENEDELRVITIIPMETSSKSTFETKSSTSQQSKEHDSPTLEPNEMDATNNIKQRHNSIPQEPQKATKSITDDKTEDTANNNEHSGTLLLLVPGLQTDENQTKTFMKEILTPKYLDLIEYIKSNNLAVNVMIAGVDGKTTVPVVDKFLYKFTKLNNVDVLHVDLPNDNVEIYELSSDSDSSSEESSKSNETSSNVTTPVGSIQYVMV